MQKQVIYEHVAAHHCLAFYLTCARNDTERLLEIALIREILHNVNA